MTSEPIRDPRADHLLTPQNCALVTDVVGGTSPEAHQAGLDSIAQPAANPLAWSRWGVSCSATGPARKPRKASRRSCSAGTARWPGRAAGPPATGLGRAADPR